MAQRMTAATTSCEACMFACSGCAGVAVFVRMCSVSLLATNPALLCTAPPAASVITGVWLLDCSVQ